jgi:hypothetical protein
MIERTNDLPVLDATLLPLIPSHWRWEFERLHQLMTKKQGERTERVNFAICALCLCELYEMQPSDLFGDAAHPSLKIMAAYTIERTLTYQSRSACGAYIGFTPYEYTRQTEALTKYQREKANAATVRARDFINFLRDRGL